MKLSEYIQQLQQFDQNLEVRIEDIDGILVDPEIEQIGNQLIIFGPEYQDEDDDYDNDDYWDDDYYYDDYDYYYDYGYDNFTF